MPDIEPLTFDLFTTEKSLKQMEDDLRTFLSSFRVFLTVELNLPQEIYMPGESELMENEVFDNRVYEITAGKVSLGLLKIWSYRKTDKDNMAEIESYIFPWLLAFRRQLLGIISKGSFWNRKYYLSSEMDFFRHRLWYEVERAKRYNVFLTYFVVTLNVKSGINEDRLATPLISLLRPYEPALVKMKSPRVDFFKIGTAVAAAEKFKTYIEQAYKNVSCSLENIDHYTFPKDFLEFQELLEKIDKNENKVEKVNR